MTAQHFLSDPLVSRTLYGLACGFLLGFGDRIARRLLEAAAVITAVLMVLFFVSGQATLSQVDPGLIIDFVKKWSWELAGLLAGWIIGYSAMNRKQRRGNDS